MKSVSKRNNVVIYGIAIAFAFLFSAIVVLYNTNAEFRNSLNEARLKSETLLSEKLSLEKQIAQFKNDISSLTGKNTELDKLLNDARQRVKEKEAQLNAIVRENKKSKDLESQLANLQALKDEIQKERDLGHSGC